MNICVIQARLHSQRLPCKALAPILGEPLIQHVIRRAKWMTTVDRVVLAVPPADVPSFVKVSINTQCAILAPDVPENDVLSRYAAVAEELGLADTDRIVRVTGDCPGLDPRVSDAVVRLAQDVDYASNTRDWPDGLDTEVFTVGALRAAEGATSDAEGREHVTPWMRRQGGMELPLEPPQRFRKWSVDDERDLEYVREIYAAFGPNWGWRQAERLDYEPGLTCEHCALGREHPKRSLTSISGKPTVTIYDLHEVPVSGGVGYAECTAHEVVRRHAEHSTAFPPATLDKSSGPSADPRGTATL